MSLRAYIDHKTQGELKPGESYNSVEGMLHSLLGKEFKNSPVVPSPVEPAPTPVVESKSPATSTSVNEEQILEIIGNIEKIIAEAKEEKSRLEKKNEDVESINESLTVEVGKSDSYVLHRDQDEVFECSVNIEGGNDANTQTRMILRTDTWNLVLDGSIKKGTCVIPIKKLQLFPEGTTGVASLEVIVDDLLFVPWEKTFIVSTSKKVSINNVKLK